MYSYDAQDDLIGVLQGGKQFCFVAGLTAMQSRCFTYDSLKELVQAANPENGTLKYSYDGSGNLSSRTDSRSSSITTNYGI